ncbi:hypothetical protein EON73_02005, partial [bacterium]
MPRKANTKKKDIDPNVASSSRKPSKESTTRKKDKLTSESKIAAHRTNEDDPRTYLYLWCKNHQALNVDPDHECNLFITKFFDEETVNNTSFIDRKLGFLSFHEDNLFFDISEQTIATWKTLYTPDNILSTKKKEKSTIEVISSGIQFKNAKLDPSSVICYLKLILFTISLQIDRLIPKPNQSMTYKGVNKFYYPNEYTDFRNIIWTNTDGLQHGYIFLILNGSLKTDNSPRSLLASAVTGVVCTTCRFKENEFRVKGCVCGRFKTILEAIRDNKLIRLAYAYFNHSWSLNKKPIFAEEGVYFQEFKQHNTTIKDIYFKISYHQYKILQLCIQYCIYGTVDQQELDNIPDVNVSRDQLHHHIIHRSEQEAFIYLGDNDLHDDVPDTKTNATTKTILTTRNDFFKYFNILFASFDDLFKQFDSTILTSNEFVWTPQHPYSWFIYKLRTADYYQVRQLVVEFTHRKGFLTYRNKDYISLVNKKTGNSPFFDVPKNFFNSKHEIVEREQFEYIEDTPSFYNHKLFECLKNYYNLSKYINYIKTQCKYSDEGQPMLKFVLVNKYTTESNSLSQYTFFDDCTKEGDTDFIKALVDVGVLDTAASDSDSVVSNKDINNDDKSENDDAISENNDNSSEEEDIQEDISDTKDNDDEDGSDEDGNDEDDNDEDANGDNSSEHNDNISVKEIDDHIENNIAQKNKTPDSVIIHLDSDDDNDDTKINGPSDNKETQSHKNYKIDDVDSDIFLNDSESDGPSAEEDAPPVNTQSVSEIDDPSAANDIASSKDDHESDSDSDNQTNGDGL